MSQIIRTSPGSPSFSPIPQGLDRYNSCKFPFLKIEGHYDPDVTTCPGQYNDASNLRHYIPGHSKTVTLHDLVESSMYTVMEFYGGAFVIH